MIKIMPESTERMLAVKASDTLTDDDYIGTWLPALEAIIEKYEVANALLYMDADFKGWDIKAMWTDARFCLNHQNDFSKIAIVGGPHWIKWGAQLSEAIMDCEIKTFEPEALQEALQWCSDTIGCACDD